MRKLYIFAAAICLALAAVSCGKENADEKSSGIDWSHSPRGTWQKDNLLTARGKVDTLDFTPELIGSKPVPKEALEAMQGRSVHLVYYIPKLSGVEDMPILIVMHGSERVGNIYAVFKAFADRYGFIVVVPEFMKDAGNLPNVAAHRRHLYDNKYWDDNDYWYGGVSTAKLSGSIRKRNRWVFNVIELIFDYVRAELDNTSEGFYMYGHSAGAQFTARMVTAFTESRIIKAVAANPGSWAWPAVDGVIKNLDTDEICNTYHNGTRTSTCGWPYTVKEIYSKESQLAAAFSRKLYLQIGTDDTENLDIDRNVQANAQGATRLFRARNYDATCRAIAERNHMDYNFELREVEGATHGDASAMVYGRADYFWSGVSFDDLGPNAAFRLLFEGVLTQRKK